MTIREVRIRLLRWCIAGAMVVAATSAIASEPKIDWLRSDADAFAKAKTQNRFVILYLEAVWCHWCHVMDEKTYGNADVRTEIDEHYVPLRIDQDLRPDLSNRYRDFGWPATVIFAADGTEIAKRQGFIEPERFLKLLKTIETNPTPESENTADAPSDEPRASALDPLTKSILVKRHRDTFDADLGGLTTGQKFLDRDSVEYELVQVVRGDKTAAAMARKTLDAARGLFDPAWGGVYQYSTYGDWKHPHFEKLATVQAQYLRIYALAFATFGAEQDRNAAMEIRRYLDTFLISPKGAFYVSQDADLKPGEHAQDYFALDNAHRRLQGTPRIDKHIYTLQNGQIIEALATWSEFGGDPDALTQAKRAAVWIRANRALPDGGFRHDETDKAGPYLGDSLAMGRAYLALYRATADRTWLQYASETASFIAKNFASKNSGYITAKSSGPIAAMPQMDENISLTRFANLLAHYTGNAEHRAIAEAALSYLANPSIALSEITEPGILLADDEFHSDPLHLTVLASKKDTNGQVLFSTVQHLGPWYKRVEWWDKSEGNLPNSDVSYPAPKRAAAFVCTENRCSLPIFKPEQIAEFVQTSSVKTVSVNASATSN